MTEYWRAQKWKLAKSPHDAGIGCARSISSGADTREPDLAHPASAPRACARSSLGSSAGRALESEMSSSYWFKAEERVALTAALRTSRGFHVEASRAHAAVSVEVGDVGFERRLLS